MKTWVATTAIAVIILGNAAIALLHQESASRLQDVRNQATALSTLTATMSSQSTPSSSAGGEEDFTAVIKAIAPTIVQVNDAGSGLQGYCSGVIISPSGYVLTADHDVAGATSITITLSTGSQFSASIASSDSNLDLAVLKMNTSLTNFPAANLGSSASLLPGQTVIAASFPLYPELPGPASFTHGIVSATRNSPNLVFIQSDADIAQGSGGGGLFTTDGKLVGILSLSETEDEAVGIYMSIPIDSAMPLIKTAGAG